MVQMLYRKRRELQLAKDRLEAALNQAGQEAGTIAALFKELDGLDITIEQLKACQEDAGGDPLARVVGTFAKWHEPLKSSCNAKLNAMEANQKVLMVHWRALAKQQDAQPAPAAKRSAAGRPPPPPSQRSAAAAAAAAAPPAADEQVHPAVKRERSVDLVAAPPALPMVGGSAAAAAAAAAAAEEPKEESKPAGPVLAFTSTGDWHRDAAIQAAVALEQQLWEDCRGEDGSASLKYLRAVRSMYAHLSPESEAHRPLLPYLLLSGLEHPANVARFTPQMLRDAGVP
ncbi:hypothetical protein COHA_006646 [Chlorella ohadii]|uniref:Uncharacterized protein n=1 Tax=Chlorella ohadii TaxID=2649997 RepID=A0AAD5H528_9CHLO|nr:hypothetical protein COHA_006646 [Chlorella ohadii]